MNTLQLIYTKAGQNPIKSAIIITLAATMVLFVLNRPSADSTQVEETKRTPTVTLGTAQTIASGDAISLLGNVRAFTQAAVTTQRAGRVVQVNVTLGQTVRAGQVLATLENAAESAAVVQAEGVYEAAVAAKAQALAADLRDSVGVDESQNTLANAQNAALAAYTSAYTTVNGAIFNNIDDLFASPNGTVPGLRIDGLGHTSFLNSERVAYQELLASWQQRASALRPTDDLAAALAAAESNIDRTIALVDVFITLFNRADSGRYSNAQLQTFSTNFTSLRTSLLGSKSAVTAAAVGLKSAQDTGTRANIGTSVSGIPAADAQIKQALGSLQSAQANYAKTVLRTPISGTINALHISQGDFVNSFVTAAEVANNNALEIVTYVSDKQRDVLSVGDSVVIENNYEGRIAQIAPAIDADTKKTEVRIATEDTNIKNGETVTITKEIATSSTQTTTVNIPLSAVKFEIKNGFVFDVVDGVLVQKPVTLGTVRGNSVEILEGLSMTDTFVIDARGLVAGTAVTVTQ